MPLTRPQLKTLRERVALVTQDVQLFQATVRDNITFFDRGIPDDQILEVIAGTGPERLAGRRCPRGWTPSLRAGGAASRPARRSCWPSRASSCAIPAWSSWTKPRRAWTPPPNSSSSAPSTSLLQNRTAIIIAHRLGTLHRTAEIMILEDGRVIEHGERDAPGRRPRHALLRPAANRSGGGAGMSNHRPQSQTKAHSARLEGDPGRSIVYRHDCGWPTGWR